MEWEKNTAASDGNTATETAPVKKDDAVIRICDLTKKYGAKKAVNKISFDVKRGEILGFLGPNGAGKSTTMNIITGYISATSGSVEVDGIDILESPKEARKKIGYLPENPPLYLDMTVSEYLNFVYELKKVREPRKEHIDGIMQIVKITHVADRMIRNLSKGYKQRVGLAQALIGNPDVLILDEPTVGLDPKQIIEIRNVIRELGRSRTVILSTHILQEVTAICDRVAIINHGRVAALDTIENLSASFGEKGKYLVRAIGSRDEVRDILNSVVGMKYAGFVKVSEPKTVDFMIEFEEGLDLRREVFEAFASGNVPLIGFRSMDLSLEEIFIKITNAPVPEDDAEEKPKRGLFERKKAADAAESVKNAKSADSAQDKPAAESAENNAATIAAEPAENAQNAAEPVSGGQAAPAAEKNEKEADENEGNL